MVNPLSLATTPIELHKGDTVISYGTGFYYQSMWNNAKQVFLITNYHVLTGNSPTDRNQNPGGDSIVFYLHMDEDNPCVVVGIKFPLFTSSGRKLWIEHKNTHVDIAIIPIVFSLPMTTHWSTVGGSLLESPQNISVGDSVTLIGYPKMYFDKKNALPIYKTGNIASEYEYDFDGNPYFIIDISAYSGNSGSPVLSIRKTPQMISNDPGVLKVSEGTRFLGVYSAGIEGKEFLPLTEEKNFKSGVAMQVDMQLGVVWRATLIEEIINQNPPQSYVETGKELVKEKGFKYKISRGLELS